MVHLDVSALHIISFLLIIITCFLFRYWINPLRYMLQGLVVSDIGSDPLGDEILNDAMGWSYNDRWWYCFVAVLFFAVLASGGVLAATRISWLQR